MKKNLIKKLVLKKHTVASLDAEQLKTLRGGRMPATDRDCSNPCGPSGNLSGLYVDGICGCYSQYYFVTCRNC